MGVCGVCVCVFIPFHRRVFAKECVVCVLSYCIVAIRVQCIFYVCVCVSVRMHVIHITCVFVSRVCMPRVSRVCVRVCVAGTKVLPCCHPCGGIRGEARCLPCLVPGCVPDFHTTAVPHTHSTLPHAHVALLSSPALSQSAPPPVLPLILRPCPVSCRCGWCCT